MDRGDLIADRYRLVEQIGRGGMGVVWLATDTTLRRPVALKVGVSADEPVAGARLGHPNVIAAYDLVKTDDGRECLVLEYLPSRSLRQIREDDGPLPPREAAVIGAQIAAALAHLHDLNMTHRDVTPANVLVTADRTAKLTDFGIATWASDTRTEDPKTGGGTPGFQAPEVVRGNRATAASDVFSLGMTIRYAVEGHPAPEAAQGAPLGVLLSRLTDRDPEARPTADTVRQQFAALARPRTPRRWRLVAAGIVVLALVTASVVWFTTRGDTEPAASEPSSSVSASGPESVMGDPRTADPCALTYANALAGYGVVETSRDYGNFNRCDALVYLTKDRKDYVDVRVEFAVDEQDDATPVQQVGAVGIQRPPAEDGSCTRILLLPGHQVVIDADQTGDRNVDLCGMAEAITSSALVSLNAGRIARRTLEAGSLAAKDACTLLDAPVVTAALGPGPLNQVHSFGDWECQWSFTDRSGVAKVVFDRTLAESFAASGSTALRVGGFDARVLPQGRSDTDCEVAIVYRSYVEDTRPRVDELVLVDVEDSEKQPEQLCDPARRLADTVAQRLSR
ncbi:protein kinase [Amycolatopsis sp. OK19-0408]|uniref:non-specific serine/threonine protein kinase n=1 Tax=Amycolatopsis iheyensis TaxID=2945988 RepID=A0A9X2NLW5_9PSEU|nr:serine/threonine-protein kinase [Amycolatopsis iheyensis]MCR6489828.1 protein kinase [Amycolatopsis iheyensis]